MYITDARAVGRHRGHRTGGLHSILTPSDADCCTSTPLPIHQVPRRHGHALTPANQRRRRPYGSVPAARSVPGDGTGDAAAQTGHGESASGAAEGVRYGGSGGTAASVVGHSGQRLVVLYIHLTADTNDYFRLNSFNGGPYEGAYSFHPRHMAVNYPGNIDDDDLTPFTQECDLNVPLDTPTGMSAFLQRVKLGDLSREAANTLPSILLEQEETDYSAVLALDAKFHAYLDALPMFFRLDTASMQHSEAICTARPVIPYQRISTNLGLHTRICRLHRPYYLHGRTDPRYAPSHAACVASAHKVLDLRRAMDDVGAHSMGPRPARLWKVAQHVFSAALVLAADVALDPSGVDAGAKREQVLAACRTLEESMRESIPLREGVQRYLQTLMATLRGEDGGGEGLLAAVKGRDGNEILVEGGALDSGDVDWDNLWVEFLDVVPELDVQGWNALLDNIDFGIPGGDA